MSSEIPLINCTGLPIVLCDTDGTTHLESIPHTIYHAQFNGTNVVGLPPTLKNDNCPDIIVSRLVAEKLKTTLAWQGQVFVTDFDEIAFDQDGLFIRAQTLTLWCHRTVWITDMYSFSPDYPDIAIVQRVKNLYLANGACISQEMLGPASIVPNY